MRYFTDTSWKSTTARCPNTPKSNPTTYEMSVKHYTKSKNNKKDFKWQIWNNKSFQALYFRGKEISEHGG